MGAVRVVGLDGVPANALTNGSWSRMLLTRERIDDNQSSLGAFLFTPGTVSAEIANEVEELIYVTRRRGELRTDEGPLSFVPGDALFVPPGVWHWVANTGTEDVEMMFSFPSASYPPIQPRYDPSSAHTCRCWQGGSASFTGTVLFFGPFH